jgi:hypothetical protein
LQILFETDQCCEARLKMLVAIGGKDIVFNIVFDIVIKLAEVIRLPGNIQMFFDKSKHLSQLEWTK